MTPHAGNAPDGGHDVSSVGPTTYNVVQNVLAFIAVIALVVVISARVLVSNRRAGVDKCAGVVARFGDLAVTDTELLVGRDIGSATRYSITGWRARVEDVAHARSVYLMLERDGQALLREMPYRKSKGTGFNARAFAQAVNVRSGQMPT